MSPSKDVLRVYKIAAEIRDHLLGVFEWSNSLGGRGGFFEILRGINVCLKGLQWKNADVGELSVGTLVMSKDGLRVRWRGLLVSRVITHRSVCGTTRMDCCHLLHRLKNAKIETSSLSRRAARRLREVIDAIPDLPKDYPSSYESLDLTLQVPEKRDGKVSFKAILTFRSSG